MIGPFNEIADVDFCTEVKYESPVPLKELLRGHESLNRVNKENKKFLTVVTVRNHLMGEN